MRGALAHAVLGLLAWAKTAGAAGAVVYGLLYALGAVLFLPGSVLTLLAGFLYGLRGGLCVVLPGSLLGATLAFFLGRTVLRKPIARRMERYPRFAAVDEAISADAFRVVLLLRLSPLFPFSLLNYALGMTRVPFRTYFLASAVGMLPGSLLYVSLGTVGTSAAELLAGHHPAPGWPGTLLFVGGLLATVAVVLLLARTARRLLETRLTSAAQHRP